MMRDSFRVWTTHVSELMNAERNFAAVQIQKIVRGRQGRHRSREVRREEEERQRKLYEEECASIRHRNEAAVKIQSYVKGFLQRKKFKGDYHLYVNARMIQRA